MMLDMPSDPSFSLKLSESTLRVSEYDLVRRAIRQECLKRGCMLIVVCTPTGYGHGWTWMHGHDTMFYNPSEPINLSSGTAHILAVLEWLRSLHSGVSYVDGEYRELHERDLLPQKAQRALPSPGGECTRQPRLDAVEKAEGEEDYG